MRLRSLLQFLFLPCVIHYYGITPMFAHAEGERDPLWNRPSFEKKVVMVGQRILQANEIPDKILFLVSKTDERNASASRFGSPNTIRIYKDMLDVIDSDDELAAVLSHEIAHITKRHTRKIYPKRVGTRLVVGTTLVTAGTAAILATGGLAAPVVIGGAALMRKGNIDVSRPIGKPYEKEADLIGLDYMVKAGYNPLAMETLQNKCAADSGPVTAFFSSHPGGTERLAYIHQAIETKYPQFLSQHVQAEAEAEDPASNSKTPTSPAQQEQQATISESAVASIPSVETSKSQSQAKADKAVSEPETPELKVSSSQARTEKSTHIKQQPSPSAASSQSKAASLPHKTASPSFPSDNTSTTRSVADLLLDLQPDDLKVLKLLNQRGYMSEEELQEQFNYQEPETVSLMLFHLSQKKLIRVVGADPNEAYILSEWAAQAFSKPK